MGVREQLYIKARVPFAEQILTSGGKMSIETVLMDFHVVPCLDELVYVRDVATVATCVAEALRQDCLEQGCISSAFSYSAIYSGPKDCMFTIKHYFREGLITLSLEYFKINQEDALLYNYNHVEQLEMMITRALDAGKGSSLPPIQRCLPRSPYLRTSDDRLLQMAWKKLLFSERTPYQLVEIYSTLDFGNVLVLDGFANLAESDLAYTHSLMCKGVQDYAKKDVLILGGGDGALLHELLKEEPKFVTMVDIDEAVMRSCKEHMRSACGDVLDKFETEKYKIIADDALKWLATYKEEGRQFDVIFGDLTDIPVHGNDTSTWNFVRTVVRTSLLLLPIGGKYLTHINGINSPNSIALFAKMVEGLGVPVEIATTEAHVPSSMEKWVFYQLTRKEGEVKEMDGAEAKVNGVESHEKKKEEEEEKAEEAKEAASEDKEGDKSETGKEEGGKEGGEKDRRSKRLKGGVGESEGEGSDEREEQCGQERSAKEDKVTRKCKRLSAKIQFRTLTRG